MHVYAHRYCIGPESMLNLVTASLPAVLLAQLVHLGHLGLEDPANESCSFLHRNINSYCS